MAEFPFPVLQIWPSRKRVPIQIPLMNIYVSEYKYMCDMCDRQNWRLHPTEESVQQKMNYMNNLHPILILFFTIWQKLLFGKAPVDLNIT